MGYLGFLNILIHCSSHTSREVPALFMYVLEHTVGERRLENWCAQSEEKWRGRHSYRSPLELLKRKQLWAKRN